MATPNTNITGFDALFATNTGALVVQMPDGTIANGNARGAFSVDFQVQRSAASKVVSGLRGFAQGRGNTVSGNDGFASGDDNTVSGSSSMASGGSNNVSGSQAGAIGASLTVGGTWGFSCGNGNSSNGAYTFSSGNNCTATNTGGQAHGNNATNRGIDFKFAYASGARSAQGDAQNGRMIIRATSTDATPGIATSNGSAAGTTNTDVLPNNSSFAFFGTAIARNTANNDSAMFTFKGLISRDASAAATAFVGTPTVTQDYADTGITTAALAMTVNTTRGSLEIQYTGIVATTIAWVIKYETVENA